MGRKRFNHNRKSGDNSKVAKVTKTPTDPKTLEQGHGSETEQSNPQGKDGGGDAGKPISDQRAMNDPSWYLKFPELAFSAGNIPFSEALGGTVKYLNKRLSCIDSRDHRWEILPDTVKSDAIPGVCSLVTKPTFGFNVNMNDALNVAAQQFYTNVRYVNSGRKNYDPADLMIAMLAISEAYSYITWMERLYGYAYMYSVRNTYINKALIEANSVDSENIRMNLANFRYWINTFISRVSAFAVPGDINMFRRRAYMYAHLYTESTTSNLKDQLYQFVPDGFYRFQLDATGKGMLKYNKLEDYITSTKLSLNDIMSMGEDLLRFIAGDEDFGLITGDIIKAYGSNIMKLEPCPEALIIVPEYEEYTLSQMRNANIVGAIRRGASSINVYLPEYEGETFKSGEVMQSNNGNLITVEMVSEDVDNIGDLLSAGVPGIITVTNPNPDISDVFEATRLKTAIDQIDPRISQNTDGYAIKCGSDIVVNVIVSQYRYNEHGVYEINELSLTKNVIAPQDSGSAEIEARFVHFHWAPTLYSMFYTHDGDSYTVDRFEVVSNVDNYTFVDDVKLENLHKVALLSLMSVPGVAQIVS